MHVSRTLLFCLTLATLLLTPFAQASDAFPGSSSFSSASNSSALLTPQQQTFLPVHQAYQLRATYLPGEQTLLQLSWTIAPDYFLYQHAFKVELNGTALPLELPAGKAKYDELLQRDVVLYRDLFTLSVNLPADTALPTVLQVHSQGCADAGLCYPPQVELVSIDSAGITSISLPAGPAPSARPERNSSLPGNPLSLLGALLAAVLGGALLNLMPCVFPVLSLKALSIAGSHQSAHSLHKHGWSYTAGAVTTFTAIAALMLALRASGEAIGWGFQLQNPVFVALLVYLFLLMSLNLLGFWQVGHRFSGAGQSLTEGHSLRASFFTGALATLVASPCTAPFMAGALGYAITQTPWVALGVFAALGFGMALPYLLLTYSPALTRRLPKPGAWMETLRQLLAFPLLLTALWLLWVAGRQTGSDGLVAILCGALALGFAIWLWQHQPRRRWQQFIAIAALLAALWPLASLETTPVQASESHDWQPYSDQRLQELLQQRQPVFVNLTADWCITCLANEKSALDTETTVAAFRDAGIVRLKGDWTNYNPEITGLLAQFDRSGVPLYLLYNGAPGSPPLILPQILREKTVLEAINQVAPYN
ncbi:protein-disulfide reductase DsbD [Pseudomaricurvus sp. HS19]|uniref:protein-disulfide reductase DsbD family protein n=1 Tax=Pseudomaricurvus sp. HS19 TaxID=2692626 RepID=UPI00136D9001|nr:protein-disulfide reductase DsbD domain-containing protein [Pseudomaricurvus sp. HS19]MYM63280.1 hypothetical protein [Pseudomaricurvus sp. HS19]